jgi:hypothetical protein
LRQLFPFADDFQVILGIALVREQRRDRLASIKRTTPPEPNDQMTTLSSRMLGSLADGIRGWLTDHREGDNCDSLYGKLIE